jgi:hypothetical protein
MGEKTPKTDSGPVEIFVLGDKAGQDHKFTLPQGQVPDLLKYYRNRQLAAQLSPMLKYETGFTLDQWVHEINSCPWLALYMFKKADLEDSLENCLKEGYCIQADHLITITASGKAMILNTGGGRT